MIMVSRILLAFIQQRGDHIAAKLDDEDNEQNRHRRHQRDVAVVRWNPSR